MPFIQNHDYPGWESLGDVFNISAATSFLPKNARIVSISGGIGSDGEYSPSKTDASQVTQFSGGHVQQFEVAMQNVEKALAAASPGLSPAELWEGVFNITSYHVGVVPQDDQVQIGAVAGKFFGRNRPAWTAICVSALFPPKVLVEIQVQAAYAIREQGN